MRFAQGRPTCGAAKRLVRTMLVTSALAPLLACGNEAEPPARPQPAAAASPSDQPSQVRQIPASKSAQPAPACPSEQFDTFLKSFANRGDVQAAYTAQPYKVKLPYYWVHSTAAGDPRYPRWDVQERHGAAQIGYRFDTQANAYVSDSGRLALDEQWRRPEQAALKPRKIGGFKIKRLSASRYEVVADGFVHSYVKKSGCWYFEQSWSFEPLAHCKWPEQCKRWQE